MASPTVFTTTLAGPSISGTRALTASKVVTGNAEDGRIIPVPAGSDGLLIGFAFKYATIQLLYVLATGANMTVFTNVDGGAGNDTLSLIAGIPTIFVVGGPYANPLAHDVTDLYIDNATAVAGQLDIYVLSQV